MARAPFQVLVLPFRRLSASIEFGALRREDDSSWQGIAGGGEADETPEAAALRETIEETGIAPTAPLYRLQTVCSVPTCHFSARASWPKDLLVIPEYSFAVDCTSLDLQLSDEHVAETWGTYETIRDLLQWDSNKTALWELNERLSSELLPEPISVALVQG